MKRVALGLALGVAVLLVILPSAAGAWARHRHGAVVVSSGGVVVVVPRSSVVVVNPVPHAAIVTSPRTVVVPAPAPFIAVRRLPHCGRWWWDGWQWVWIRAWC